MVGRQVPQRQGGTRIGHALAECDGNVTRTAEALDIDRSHLYRRMKALGISDKRPGQSS